jgi:hypothetical protein
VTDLPPKDRDIAMVFQNYALPPHLTLSENLSFPLEIARLPKEQIRHRVHEVASILDIEQFLDRKPRALSGGQPQRVAMCRAIVRSPHVFLMDEPLSNLDAKLRTQTRTQIAALQRRQGHDRLRDPRPGRSHGRWATGWRCSATACFSRWHAARALRAAGQRVRGRVYEFTGHEPARAAADRRRRPLRGSGLPNRARCPDPTPTSTAGPSAPATPTARRPAKPSTPTATRSSSFPTNGHHHPRKGEIVHLAPRPGRPPLRRRHRPDLPSRGRRDTVTSRRQRARPNAGVTPRSALDRQCGLASVNPTTEVGDLLRGPRSVARHRSGVETPEDGVCVCRDVL